MPDAGAYAESGMTPRARAAWRWSMQMYRPAPQWVIDGITASEEDDRG